MPNLVFHDYIVHDLMSHIEGITSRAMFGGWGIYKHGTVFAIIAEEQLFFKIDNRTVKDYKDAGSVPFTYEAARGKKVVMSYWAVPAHILEGRELLSFWIKKACAASLRTKKNKRKTVRVQTHRNP